MDLKYQVDRHLAALMTSDRGTSGGAEMQLDNPVSFSLAACCHIPVYNIFKAILILFLVIFEDDKSDNFLRGDKSFRTLKRTESRQKQSK